MTTPDHRPYLTATDLRTPEDVLDAMAAYHPCEEVGDVVCELRARLDRERRQACRRAACAYVARARQHHDSAREWAESEPDESFTRAMLDVWAEAARACFRESLTRALAFRAAARTP